MNQFNILKWQPAGTAPLYVQIADALHEAIRNGEATPGSRLPTQRALAAQLDVSVGTATSAYLEAERRGLVRRHVGRGTFVASPGTRAQAPRGQINLAMNLPPFHGAVPMIRSLLTQLIDDVDTNDLLGYPQFGEASRYASAAAGWISRTTRMGHVAPQRVLPCQGATQGLLASMGLELAPGDTVVCEAATYGGFKVIARLLGVTLVTAVADEEGIVPDSLEAVARANRAKAVVLCPTLQNPTGAIASEARRAALAKVARSLDLWIFEDDVYGALVSDRTSVPPVAVLAPERTFYVGSASKAIAPGLRAGWVMPPAARLEALAEALNARTAAAAPFGCPMLTAGAAPFGFLAFSKLCETRLADEIAARIRTEAERRGELAQRVLAGHVNPRTSTRALHVWLGMPADRAEALHASLGRQEIHVTPPGAPMVGVAPEGLRVCLGGPERIEDLAQALHVVAGELGATRPEATHG